MEKFISEERIDKATEEELFEMRLWIYKESQRLEAEQKTVDSKVAEIEAKMERFRAKFQSERSQFEHDKQKFKDDQALFDQQIEILKDGFDKLNADKKKLEREWKKLEQEKGYLREDEYSRAEFFFQGVNSLLALKKRYRDLMKIYHPDNLCGDHKLCDMINEEYNILLRQFDTYMKA
ncbi:hypothetical protein [Butyrivibrio sp. WCD2001]|uniref:hypothetical protein n=1 Tax=Butyrivibrio sp. WCD2001 TaxID=1280681 RepID=UPI00041EB54C|nr:hypothetical protein [Butyrivibrio sp. WCD2001]